MSRISPSIQLRASVAATLCVLAACFLSVSALAAPAAPKNGPSVFISVDMEGIAGVVTIDQLTPDGFEYERFRKFMTDEALAAVRAAQSLGAAKIVIADAHGNGESLLIEQFPREVQIVRSWPRRGGMMAGLDSSFNAAVMIGYHASASSQAGVRAHTISSATFSRIAINGQDVSEGELGAAQAGALGVPVVFVSGDDVATAELSGRIGNIVTVQTKKALGFHSAQTVTPAEADARIEAGVRVALGRLKEFKPYLVATPVQLEISYKNYAPAEMLSYLPGVSRVGSRSVRITLPDIAAAVDFIFVAEAYRADLSP